jgi:hypothetical protein
MKTPEIIFRESIEQYRNLIRKTSELCDNIASFSTDTILKHCGQVQELQKNQAEIDRVIIDVMHKAGPQISKTQYVNEYRIILNEAKQSSDKAASKANMLRTLMHAEITKLRHGQKSLAGYTAVARDRVNYLDGRY